MTFGARAEEKERVQRYLAHLHLGDSIEEIRKVYRPVREWPAYVEPRGRVTRIRVDRDAAKGLPLEIETLWLGMKKGRLVEIQLVYGAKASRRKPVETLVVDLSLIYGEGHQSEGKFWWSDSGTVLRVFYAEVPLLKGGERGFELRTSLQLMEAGLFKRTD